MVLHPWNSVLNDCVTQPFRFCGHIRLVIENKLFNIWTNFSKMYGVSRHRTFFVFFTFQFIPQFHNRYAVNADKGIDPNVAYMISVIQSDPAKEILCDFQVSSAFTGSLKPLINQPLITLILNDLKKILGHS